MEIMVDASQLGSFTSTEADGLSLLAQLETVQSELRGPISENVIESPPSQSLSPGPSVEPSVVVSVLVCWSRPPNPFVCCGEDERQTQSHAF